MATKKHEGLGAIADVVVEAVKDALHPEQIAVLEAAAEKAGAVTQMVALDAFCRFKFGGKNFDQAAGFKRWVKGQKKHLARLPESTWTSLLEEFQNKRIGG